MPWWGWIPVGLAVWLALSVVSGLMAGQWLYEASRARDRADEAFRTSSEGEDAQ